jgi:hypothetical protein
MFVDNYRMHIISKHSAFKKHTTLNEICTRVSFNPSKTNASLVRTNLHSPNLTKKYLDLNRVKKIQRFHVMSINFQEQISLEWQHDINTSIMYVTAGYDFIGRQFF